MDKVNEYAYIRVSSQEQNEDREEINCELKLNLAE